MSITVNIYYTGENGVARKFAEEMISGGTVDAIRNEEGNIRYDYFYPINDKETLDEVQAIIDENAVNRAIKIGICNIFHGCVHNMLYEKSEDILRELYKSASFVVQVIAFKQTGNYIRHQKELIPIVSLDERVIVENFLSLKNDGVIDFDLMSETLFGQRNELIKTVKLI